MVNKEKEIIVRPKETLLGVHICGGASQFVCAFVDKFVCQGSLSAEVYVRKSQVCPIRPIQGGTYSPLPLLFKKEKNKLEKHSSMKTKTISSFDTSIMIHRLYILFEDNAIIYHLTP